MLPNYEDGFLFYDIEFFYFKSNVFLYPEMCLTSGPLEILPSVMDPLSRIYKFIGDLREKVAKLCEQQLDIYLKVRKQATYISYNIYLHFYRTFSTKFLFNSRINFFL